MHRKHVTQYLAQSKYSMEVLGCRSGNSIASSNTDGVLSACQALCCSLTSWSSSFNKPCMHDFSTRQAFLPVLQTCQKKCPLHTNFALLSSSEYHRPSTSEQPCNLSNLHPHFTHYSLLEYLPHCVTVVCFFFASSCEFLEGGDHLFTGFIHLLIYSSLWAYGLLHYSAQSNKRGNPTAVYVNFQVGIFLGK